MIPVLGVPTLLAGSPLTRLLRSIDHPVGHLVVIDNGRWWPRCQRMDNAATHAEIERVSVVEMPGNLGVAGSWNLIIKATPFAPWWLIVNDDAWFRPGDLARLAADADPDALVLSSAHPAWSCFALGAGAVARVGLFDERFHPAYFEDNDYERRCRLLGVPVRRSDVAPSHVNSSTLDNAPGAQAGNAASFAANGDLHRRKSEARDLTEGWDLTRRRALAWEPHDAPSR